MAQVRPIRTIAAAPPGLQAQRATGLDGQVKQAPDSSKSDLVDMVKVRRGPALTKRRFDRYLPSDSYAACDVTPIGVNTNASEEESRTTTVSS